MGAEQRKHPATEARSSSVSLKPGSISTARWTERRRPPTATVREVYLAFRFK